MTDNNTATGPDGVVHKLANDKTTVCGENATAWSTAVTMLQELGLVIFCKECEKS